MIAKAGGEVVFQTNPSDVYGFGFNGIQYNPTTIRFGYARLQIGDPVQFPVSPWRNPQAPSDVDGNGEVNENDLELIEMVMGFREPPTPYRSPVSVDGIDRGQEEQPDGVSDEILALIALGAQGKIVLDGSTVAPNASPYLDVNGDRVVDRLDVLQVREMFIKMPEPGEAPFAAMFRPDFQVDLSVVNLRTNQPLVSGDEVLVGDLIELRFPEKSRGLPVKLRQSLIEPFAKRIEFREDVLQVTAPGSLELKFDVLSDMLGRLAMVAGVTPEFFKNRIDELFNPLARKILVRENTNRPTASDRTFEFDLVKEIKTAREAAELLSATERIKLEIAASQGLLKDATESELLRIVIVANPHSGTLQVKEDGSFIYSIDESFARYSLYDLFAQGDRFSYVLVSPSGTSEIRKVQIPGITIPLIDLKLRAVDSDGNEITSARVGQEFFIEASAYANDNYRRVPAQFKPFHPLFFDYKLDSNVAQAVGPVEPTDRFNWERYHLEKRTASWFWSLSQCSLASMKSKMKPRSRSTATA